MPIKIFYLDDEEKLCELFAEYFSSELVQITTFVDANRAIESSRSNPPDLFFIDYRLAGTTGDEVAQAIEQSIPKVLVTGNEFFTPSYNFAQIISKPYDFSLIQGLIDACHKTV